MTNHDQAMLLLDDGELDEVAALLDRSKISYRRLRGAQDPGSIDLPIQLLITTPRHAASLSRTGANDSRQPDPLRIVATTEDSPSLRRKLRAMGFNLLVRQPAHLDTWRLLIQRALFQGDERRRETRLPVGAQIVVRPNADRKAQEPAPRTSLLADISNRGCHFIGDEPFPLGARVRFELADRHDAHLCLTGEIVRTGPWTGSDPPRHSCAMQFDDDLDDATRTELARLINGRISGPLSLATGVPNALSLPACDSPVLPGLQLDDETDPLVATDLAVELAFSDTSSADDERRKRRRADYQQRVVVENQVETSVLIGRDLSSGGMRVERFSDVRIGAHLDLALYGPRDSEPIQIDAEIIRDDGERGIGLRFCNLSRDESQQLERFVACLPAVESLEDGEAEGLGSVLAEVRSRSGETRDID